MSPSPSRRGTGTGTGTGDRAHAVPRQVAVTVSFLLAMAGTAIGVGAFGGVPIGEAAGGLLAPDATHLAPASPAFSIWTVIYIGLGAYTLWQWRDRHDHRRIAAPAIASLLLNAAWILLIQAGQVWLSVLVILLLLVVLAELFRRTTARPARGPLERLVVDGTFGLYLGWVCVATCANIAAALAGSGFTGIGSPEWTAVAVLAVAGAVGVALCLAGRRPIAAPLAVVWGLTWIAVARTTGEPHSEVTAIAAGIAAAATAVATISQWARRSPGPDPDPDPEPDH